MCGHGWPEGTVLHRVRRCYLIAGFVVWIAVGSRSFQTNIISGVTSNWVDAAGYFVGSNWVYDALVIQNSGGLSNKYGYIGYEANATNNAVLVTGTGSLWSNAISLVIGYYGSCNSLT